MATKKDTTSKKPKTKIFRKYQDFYSTDDLRDPDTLPYINLNIADFDARGRIVKPPAPCVVTTVDPDYIKAAGQQRLAKKFRMKTDILRLREITRKKFMIYATQEMHLEKQREVELQEQTYQRILKFCEFSAKSLQEMEAGAFKQMRESQEKLKSLGNVQLDDELKTIKNKHQRVLLEVNVVYGRFQYLIKLISYFDIIEGEDAPDDSEKIALPLEIATVNLKDNTQAGKHEAELLEAYMQQMGRPYLEKRKHLNGEIWLKSYELMRTKMFNYYKRFTNLALLNHIVALVYDRFQRTFREPKAAPILKDPNFMQLRIEKLKTRADQLLDDFGRHKKQDKITRKLDGIVPIIMTQMERTILRENAEVEQEDTKSVKSGGADSALSSYRAGQVTTLSKVECIQAHLLYLLNELDAMPPELVRTEEKRIRRRMRMEKDMSRRALVKQLRLHNWMSHFKKHELQRQAE